MSDISTDEEAVRRLETVRDWLRYAVSRFSAADISFGHGTETALDEAAFLILATLRLPIDKLDPFLDARLLEAERRALARCIEERIATRKPAAYLVGEAWIGPYRFRSDERAIVPRSLIGELLCGDLADLIPEPAAIGRVLDLCTGSGCLAILAALAFPSARVDAVDLSPEALALARQNVDDYGLEDRIELLEGDLLAPVRGRRYDLILSNPPYVGREAMAALPPEYRHEPAMALAGGEDGLDIVRRILDKAGRHLTETGGLMVEIGTGQDLLVTARPDLPFLWLDTEASRGEVFWLEAAALAPARKRPRQA